MSEGGVPHVTLVQPCCARPPIMRRSVRGWRASWPLAALTPRPPVLNRRCQLAAVPGRGDGQWRAKTWSTTARAIEEGMGRWAISLR